MRQLKGMQMAKFTHVDADRVRSAMRKLEELAADHEEWAADRKRLQSEAAEIRGIRDRDHVLEAEQAGSFPVAGYPTRSHGRRTRPGD